MLVKRLAIASLSFATLSGCAEDQETLIVTGAAAWPTTDMAGSCLVNPSATALLSFGLLDVFCADPNNRCAVSTAYYIPAILANQATPQSASAQNSGTDNSEIQLKEVDVLLRSEQAEGVLALIEEDGHKDFTLPLAADSLPAGVRKGVPVEAINSATGQALFDAGMTYFEGVWQDFTVLATLTFHGERTGNAVGNIGDVSARDYTFPIKLCYGCLLSCGECDADQCSSLDLGTLTWTGGICGNAQDGPIVPRICE